MTVTWRVRLLIVVLFAVEFVFANPGTLGGLS